MAIALLKHLENGPESEEKLEIKQQEAKENHVKVLQSIHLLILNARRAKDRAKASQVMPHAHCSS